MFSSRILRSILVLLALSAYTLPSHGMIRTMANRLARATQTIRAQAGAKITPIATQTAQKPLIQATQPAAQQSWWHKFTASLNNAWAYIKQNITLPTWFSKNQISVYAKKVASSTAKAIGSRMPLAAGIVTTAAAQAQEKEKKFTVHDIKTRNYDMAYRQEALAFALAHITTQDVATIELITAILETYHESHEPLVNAALTHFNNTHPLLIKNILAHNAWAADKFVKLLISTENPHLEKLFSDNSNNKNYQWAISHGDGLCQFGIAKLIIDTIVAMPDQCPIQTFNAIYQYITSNKSFYLSYSANRLRESAARNWGKDAKTMIDLASGIIDPKQITEKPLCVYLNAKKTVDLSEIARLTLKEINTLSPEHIQRSYNLCHNTYKTKTIFRFVTQAETYSQTIKAEAKKRFNKPEFIEKMTARELLYAHYANNYIPSFPQYHTRPFNLTMPQLFIPSCCYEPTLEQIKKSTERDIASLPTEYIDYAYEHIFQGKEEKEKFKQTINTLGTYNTNIPLKTKDTVRAAMQLYDENVPSFTFECTQDNHQLSQSEKHFCANTHSVIKNIFQGYNIKKKTNAILLFKKALKKERAELAKGNHVFYHGRQWEWDLVSDIYKELYNINNTKSFVGNDYTFLRFDDSTARFGQALFLNAPLFGSSKWYGNSTAQLILKSFDWSGNKAKEFTPQKLFSQFNLEQYYPRYENEFKKLATLHQQANPSNIGSLLMVSINDADVNTVYPVRTYANKPDPVTLSTGEQTLEAKKILAELKAGVLPGGGDTIEYVLPLTKEYALDPQKGPRIYAMNACDPAKYKEYSDFRDQLFAKIKADMQQHEGSIS